MKKTQILAIFAFALALGLTAPIADVFATDGDVASEEGGTGPNGGDGSEEQGAGGGASGTDSTDNGEGGDEDGDAEPGKGGDTSEGDDLGGSDETEEGKGGDTSEGGDVTPVETRTEHVTTEADLLAVINDTTVSTIILDGDIIVTSPIVINRAVSAFLTIDLNGHKIANNNDSSANHVLVIENGSIEVRGGKVDASDRTNGIAVKIFGHSNDYEGGMGAAGKAGGDVDEEGSYFTVAADAEIISGNVTGTDRPAAYGIAIYQAPGTKKATKTMVYVFGKVDATQGSGGIIVLGNVQEGNSTPYIYVSGDVEGGTAGIYLAGKGTVYVANGGKVSGKAGIITKAGHITVGEGATVEGTGAYNMPPTNNDGATSTGAAIQIEANNAYAGDVTVFVADGATLKSANGYVIHQYGKEEGANVVEWIMIDNGATLIAGKDAGNPISGIEAERVEFGDFSGGLGSDEEEEVKSTAVKPGNQGVLADAEVSAKSASVAMPMLVAVLAMAGSAVVALRNAFRKANKN